MEIRDTLGEQGFHFKKKFGQNFLTDPNLLSAIASDAGVDNSSTVLEIGTGAGTLTRVLSERARRVVGYEIDRSLEPVLARTLIGCENTEIVFSDFLRSDLAALERELGSYLVVANLPYYITTPVVMRFLEDSQTCRGITVMVQEEVARRLTARENTPEYGAITAAIALRGSARITRKVPRTMFTPRPNVDSAVVRIIFGEGAVKVRSAAMYRSVVRCAFLNRRKTLENNLMAAMKLTREEARALLLAAGVPEGARGETLSPEGFARLADLLTPVSPKEG